MTIHIGPKYRYGLHGALKADILRDAPRGYWLCDEASGTTIYDYSGNGYDLTISGTAGVDYELQGAGLLADGTRFLRTVSGATISRADMLGLPVPFNYDWSACCLIRREASGVSNYIITFAANPNIETEAGNVQLSLAIDSSSNFFRAAWERGAGTDVVLENTFAGRTYSTHLLHAVKDTANAVVRFYVDGRFVWSEPYSFEPTGGTDASMTTFVGCAAGTTALAKVLGHVAFFPDKQLSEARIHSHAISAGRMVSP